jgi:serine/threonine protein kinase
MQVLARLPYTTQVDMWAIGVITYILLSGMMPFDDDNHTRLYRQILRAHYTCEGDVCSCFVFHWFFLNLFSQNLLLS